jgi:curved DNA-binding protein CbpA
VPRLIIKLMVEQSGTDDQPQFSPEDQAIAKQIIAKKDFYQILGVEKTATDDEIKKAYRKLALRVHPDKNRAPESQDAFKKVGQAYANLSDAQKRRHYDMTGQEQGS